VGGVLAWSAAACLECNRPGCGGRVRARGRGRGVARRLDFVWLALRGHEPANGSARGVCRVGHAGCRRKGTWWWQGPAARLSW
jgi:hypothetical protein